MPSRDKQPSPSQKSSCGSIERLISDALAMEDASAQEAGTLGFMARALVQATMPHRKTDDMVFMRENGAFSLALMAHPKVGLPYGSIPRLLVAFLTTEAVRTKSRDIELGGSLSEFMSILQEVPTGGRRGSIRRVRNQTNRLFASSVSCTYTAKNANVGANLAIADTYELWWDPKQPNQDALFRSHVRLGERFFDEVTSHPVPIDMRALKALKKSPLALDIYTWLTYRMSYLRRPTEIPWEALAAQFGSNYVRVRAFREAFGEALLKVHAVYPDVRVESTQNGLLLKPSRPHVLPRSG